MKHSLEQLNDLFNEIFGWHSKLEFDRPDFSLAKNGNAMISNAAKRLTPEYDSTLDVNLLKEICDYYEERIVNFISDSELSGGEVEIHFSSSENWIFYYIHYNASKAEATW